MDSDSNASVIANETPHFFKIILQRTICQGSLRLPPKFVEKYGKFLSSPVTLQVPPGKTWKIELSKNGNEVWLQKGCQDFFNHYSLDFGHLLVFKYIGNCHFSVAIFDRSAVEIEYANRSLNSRVTNPEEHNVQDKRQDKISDTSGAKIEFANSSLNSGEINPEEHNVQDKHQDINLRETIPEEHNVEDKCQDKISDNEVPDKFVGRKQSPVIINIEESDDSSDEDFVGH